MQRGSDQRDDSSTDGERLSLQHEFTSFAGVDEIRFAKWASLFGIPPFLGGL
jgi:hypothetical protein